MSSTVILFNKWILDTAKFRECPTRRAPLPLNLLTLDVQIIVSRPRILPFTKLIRHFLSSAITLTCWHLTFATLMTQVMARFTSLLDGRKTVKMTGRVYLRAIVPIGAFFSLSLICGNLTYLYLSVAFIQMLKVCGGILQADVKTVLMDLNRLPHPSQSYSLDGVWESIKPI